MDQEVDISSILNDIEVICEVSFWFLSFELTFNILHVIFLGRAVG